MMRIRITHERIRQRRRQEAVSRYLGSPSALCGQLVTAGVATVVASGLVAALLHSAMAGGGLLVSLLVLLSCVNLLVHAVSSGALKGCVSAPTELQFRVYTMVAVLPSLLAVLVNARLLSIRLEDAPALSGLTWFAILGALPLATVAAAHFWRKQRPAERGEAGLIRISRTASEAVTDGTVAEPPPPAATTTDPVRSGSITAFSAKLKCPGCGNAFNRGDEVVMCKHDPPHRAHRQCATQLLANKCPICGREFKKKWAVFSQ